MKAVGPQGQEIFHRRPVALKTAQKYRKNYARVDCREFFSKFKCKAYLSYTLPHWPGRGRILIKVTIKGAFPSCFLLNPSMSPKAIVSLGREDAGMYPHPQALMHLQP